MEKRSTEIEILGISRDGKWKKTDELVHEEEIIVKLNGEIQKFYCIPVDLEDMIAGYLKSRGIDPSLSQIKKLGSNEFEVNVPEELVKTPRNCDSKKQLTKSEIFDLIKALNENSFLYQKTGCAHVIGICEDKEIFVEDTSRHCAIDKAIGLAIRDGINLANSSLITSCRQTASIIRKAIFCEIPIVISISATTDLAIEEANKYGITLIGFASSKWFKIYSHDWRIEI
ncbi:MAG TPA: formate dehydrogenase accessory sulfurtransferase FdhD [Dehalococcoidia bacterium]|nr:formate dehydrogenase accessory sulfurtransferase FdhD [Dehalococcoidia bacterium]